MLVPLSVMYIRVAAFTYHSGIAPVEVTVLRHKGHDAASWRDDVRLRIAVVPRRPARTEGRDLIIGPREGVLRVNRADRNCRRRIAWRCDARVAHLSGLAVDAFIPGRDDHDDALRQPPARRPGRAGRSRPARKSGCPSDKLMTSILYWDLFAMANSIALMTVLLYPEPYSSSTFIPIRRAPRATLRYTGVGFVVFVANNAGHMRAMAIVVVLLALGAAL